MESANSSVRPQGHHDPHHHNIGVVEYIADHVAVMHAGRIVEQGSGEAVLQRPQHEYTRTLLAAVPRLAAAA